MRRNITCFTTRAVCVLIALLSCTAAYAVKMPAIFGTNMVLQRNIKIPVWGWADASEKVQIDFMGTTFKATAGNDGKWALKLNSYPAGGPYQMIIKGAGSSITYKNIWIGDVWFASGQSNIEFGLKNDKNYTETIANAKDSLIHVFLVGQNTSLTPLSDVLQKPNSPAGKWIVCSPTMLNDPSWNEAWPGFSALGYYFCQQIRPVAKCAVGLVSSYKGGSIIQAWMSIPELSAPPAFSASMGIHQNLVDHYAEATASYPQKQAEYEAAIKIWNDEVGKDFYASVKVWETAVAQAKANGTAIPPRPKPSRPAPVAPGIPDGGFTGPANLFNAMIDPVAGYGIKGFIWYQGESNGEDFPNAIRYKDLFPRLIDDFRNNWHQGNLPFLYVQLANYRAAATTPSEGNWPWIREAQQQQLSISQTGMATAIDLGEANNIHFTNKRDLGYRLGLVARSQVYGEKLVSTGPKYQSMKVNGHSIELSFDKASPLIIGSKTLPNSNTNELKGFGIAGADQQFYWAKAEIKGNKVIITSEQVANPVAVRYNWADNPPGNLYNEAGLPAFPFRTDDWTPRP